MILLINPKTIKPSEHQTDFFREPSLGILYLAAILDQEEEFNVDIFDLEQFPDLNNFQIKEIIKEKIENYRIFGITSLTNTFHIALEIAEIIKDFDKNNCVVLGGPHVSFQYKEILEFDKSRKKRLIDFICVGESEGTFLNLIKLLYPKSNDNDEFNLSQFKEIDDSLNSIKALAYVNLKGEIIFTGYSDNPINLERLPLPARYKLPQENSFYSVANVIVNRGCPNQCSFCSRQNLFKDTRIRSIGSILSEIQDIISYQSYKYINFYDNININRGFFQDFCKMFIENNINVPWGCELRVDSISIEDAELLKDAGCKLVATGIESGSNKVLKANFKYQDPERVKVGISNLKRYKIPIQAYFVLGLPKETERTFYKTVDYIKKLPLIANDKINFFVATPYPGSRLWDDHNSFKITIFETDFSKYDCEHIIFETEDLNKKKLERLLKVAKDIEKSFSHD